jgi:hypothetical protein
MLTVVQIRALKPASKPYKVADVDGLFLLVQQLFGRRQAYESPRGATGRA